jgi:hypothetical protein
LATAPFEIRNPKPEIRDQAVPEGDPPFNPNSEVGTESVVWGRLSSLPMRATFQSPDTELESSVNRQTRMSALQALGSVPARPSSELGFNRGLQVPSGSDFGFRISAFFRASGFGLRISKNALASRKWYKQPQYLAYHTPQ